MYLKPIVTVFDSDMMADIMISATSSQVCSGANGGSTCGSCITSSGTGGNQNCGSCTGAVGQVRPW